MLRTQTVQNHKKYALYLTVVEGSAAFRTIGTRYPDDVGDTESVDRYISDCLQRTDRRFILHDDWRLREIHAALRLPDERDRLLALEVELPLPAGLGAHTETIPVIMAVDYPRSHLPLTLACDIMDAKSHEPIKAVVIRIRPDRRFQVSEVTTDQPPRDIITADQPLTPEIYEVAYSQSEL